MTTVTHTHDTKPPQPGTNAPPGVELTLLSDVLSDNSGVIPAYNTYS